MLATIAALAVAAAGALAQSGEPVAAAAFALDETLARGPAILVFWNSWLPGSPEFAPLVGEIEAAAAEHGWPGAIVVFQDDGEEWARRIGASGRALTRVIDRRGELLRRFKVTRAPTVLVVDRRGQVIDRAGAEAAAVRALLQGLAGRSGS